MDLIKAEAMAAGVHPECYAKGPDGACLPCRAEVMEIFNRRYDHLETVEEVRMAIYRDTHA